MKNNKNAILFIVYFAVAYILLSVIYQAILVLFEPKADFFTTLVSKTVVLLFKDSSITELKNTPGYLFSINHIPVVNIKEGCNGIAVFVTVVSFCIAFKGYLKTYFWFLPVSFLLIQIANIIRLYILIRIKISTPLYFDFFHVYVFPAIIYLMAFVIMVWWVKKYSYATGK
ncbi:MAG: hypothetical protein ACK4K9_07800 [Bacteroidia bacterium]